MVRAGDDNVVRFIGYMRFFCVPVLTGLPGFGSAKRACVEIIATAVDCQAGR